MNTYRTLTASSALSDDDADMPLTPEPGAMDRNVCVDCGKPYRAPRRAFNGRFSGRCLDCRWVYQRAQMRGLTRRAAAERESRKDAEIAALAEAWEPTPPIPDVSSPGDYTYRVIEDERDSGWWVERGHYRNGVWWKQLAFRWWFPTFYAAWQERERKMREKGMLK